MWRLLVAVLVGSMCVVGPMHAAEIQAMNWDCFFIDKCHDSWSNTVVIRGTIVEGDSAKFRDIILQGVVRQTVILRSRGGDVQEAMKIGRDIRTLLLETEGPQLDYYPDREGTLHYGGSDYPLCIENGVGQSYQGSRYKGSECVCASACFLLYVAGAKRALSYVGIHRGYVRGEISRDLGLDAAAQLYKSISKPISDYLRDMGVPPRYADIMLRTSSQELYNPKLPEVMADFYGWIPEIDEWLIAKCNTVSERQLWEDEKKAVEVGQLSKFIESRDRREGCIQDLVMVERSKRLDEYLRR